MLTLNTNISSLITQRSLKSSTEKLNQAIERMTTGFKINHASDNAANYSISTNMTTKINSLMVAEDNTSMGLDLINTAGESLSQIQDKLERLRALQEQAANGTYGEQSLQAINKEVNAIVDEIERLRDTTEYNGIQLFGKMDKFINPVTRRDTSTMTKLSSVDPTMEITSGTYSISTAEELAQLATMTNSGKIGYNTEFVLANDIDLSAYSTGEGWTPIGGDNAVFYGTFDGNGYVVKNLYINRPDSDYQGLFGKAFEATIKNLGVENANVTGNDCVGGLVGHCGGTLNGAPVYPFLGVIVNSYLTGSVVGNDCVGGLVGFLSQAMVTVNYLTGSVRGNTNVEDLVGCADYGSDVSMDNMYDSEISGRSNDIFGGYGVGVTTSELQTLVTKVSENNISFQVGTNSDSTSQISINTAFGLNISALRGIGLGGNYLSLIDFYNNAISAKQTDYGAVSNRLESALEEITTQYDNLVSSRSTLRDADVAKLSAEYIQQQILQQASATLLATANQTPSLALQLL